MSSDVAIQVEGLSKAYQIYERPVDRLKQFIVPRLQRAAHLPVRQYHRDFWALRDLSFTLKKGQTMGIVGRNGSGKSTLLQMVCGTLTPTTGSIRLNGRVAALLELGSGFNPEFTGRDNVFLNAAVLGLGREETERRYGDIVAFADIGQFIDQPVKTYSSGMMVRLAFSVIAHVDADILIIDEALAVGDAVFTQKCMRWLRAFQKEGTILFVSHDTASVRALCNVCLWLKDGQCAQIGSARDVTEAYLRFTQEQIAGETVRYEDLRESSGGDGKIALSPDYDVRAEASENVHAARGWKTGEAEVLSVTMENATHPDRGWLEGGEDVCLRIRARCRRRMDAPILGFLCRDRLGQDLFGENTLAVTDLEPVAVDAGGEVEAEFHFRLPMLPNGTYEIMASIAEGTLADHVQHHWLNDALILTVTSGRVRWGLVGIPFKDVKMRALS